MPTQKKHPAKSPPALKVSTSYRFSFRFRYLLRQIAEKEGLSDTAYLEMAIRRLARAEGLLDE